MGYQVGFSFYPVLKFTLMRTQIIRGLNNLWPRVAGALRGCSWGGGHILPLPPAGGQFILLATLSHTFSPAHPLVSSDHLASLPAPDQWTLPLLLGLITQSLL